MRSEMTPEKQLAAFAAFQEKRREPLRLLVISDTHNDPMAHRRALKAAGQVDAAVHLGDLVGDGEAMRKESGLPMILVRGNCDPYDAAPDAMTFVFGGVTFLAVHGHEDGVRYDKLNLYYHAMEENASVALYGHTHISEIDRQGNVWMINPGSASRPRMSQNPSCAIIEVRDGKVSPGILTW